MIASSVDGVRQVKWQDVAARLRLWSGIILFLFATTHFLNHALGLVSLDAMQTAQTLRGFVTRSIPGQIVLALAAATHLWLGFARIVRLRTWRIGTRGALQLTLGLIIPVFLIRHVIDTSGAHYMHGTSTDYAYALWAFWPNDALRLAILMLLVWVHGCIGLHMYLSTKRWYRENLWAFFGLSVLVPALGYAGFVSAGRLAKLQSTFESPFSSDQYREMTTALTWGSYSYYGIIAGAFLVWLLLVLGNKLGSRVTISYANGLTVTAPLGLSLLEISRRNRIPHASICGGKARCSTCRVRVTEGLANLPAASQTEREVLKRIGAPPSVRLACQLRPTSDLSISTLLPAKLGSDDVPALDKYHWGVEREITVLFVDLRGFTSMSEGRLPFDVVFIMNQFLGRMSEATEDSGGFVDKFMGDGMMAIFGMDDPPDVGVRQAIAAARAMGGLLEGLNQSLHEELQRPLSVGIGIHSGPAILGRIAAARRNETVAQLTAFGETVNVASRLESMTKEVGAQVAISAYSMALSGLTAGDRMTPHRVDIRGLSQPMDILVTSRATHLPQPE